MGLDDLAKNCAYLLTDYYERLYFSNVVNSEGYVIVLSDKTYYFTDARYFFALKEKLKNSSVIPRLYTCLDDISRVLKENGIEKLGVDFDKTTLTEYNEYLTFNIEIFDCSLQVKKLRAVKNEQEIENIKIACNICEKSFYEALSHIKVGMTERELCEIIKSRFIENGASGESFSTIVAFNENSAVPHHETSDKILTNDSVILIDTGCVYKGYLSDFTRTVFFGTPTKKFIDCYNAVWGANELAEKLIKDGDSFVYADSVARDYLKNNNLDKFFTHSLGHGVGLEIHEYPTLSKRAKTEDTIKENMVFTIEPGVYFDNEFGIRIEDTVVIKNGKVERLFTDSKDLITIDENKNIHIN